MALATTPPCWQELLVGVAVNDTFRWQQLLVGVAGNDTSPLAGATRWRRWQRHFPVGNSYSLASLATTPPRWQQLLVGVAGNDTSRWQQLLSGVAANDTFCW